MPEADLPPAVQRRSNRALLGSEPNQEEFEVRKSSSEEPAQQLQRCQARLRVISDVTRQFAEATTDYQRLLQSVARSLAEAIKDSCVVFLLSEDGASVTAAAMHAADPRALEQIRADLAERPLLLAEQPALRNVLDTGKALVVPKPDSSFLVVPLLLGGRSIGVLSLGRFGPESPAFDEADQDLAQNLADHASLAIENSRLYAAAVGTRRAAERAEQPHHQFFERAALDAAPVAAST